MEISVPIRLGERSSKRVSVEMDEYPDYNSTAGSNSAPESAMTTLQVGDSDDELSPRPGRARAHHADTDIVENIAHTHFPSTPVTGRAVAHESPRHRSRHDGTYITCR